MSNEELFVRSGLKDKSITIKANGKEITFDINKDNFPQTAHIFLKDGDESFEFYTSVSSVISAIKGLTQNTTLLAVKSL